MIIDRREINWRSLKGETYRSRQTNGVWVRIFQIYKCNK